MNKQQLSVDVCIATFKRPDLLLQTLTSLSAQQLENILMRIIVVDNDQKESARNAVTAFEKSVPFEVIYDVEPIQSIPRVRNRAIRHVQADYFAFLDDDETVSANWLVMKLATLKKYSADVVFGPVIDILPSNAPQWAKKHSCFNRPRYPSGALMDCGSTGNVLMRRDALGQPPQEFDSAYDLTGGEDSDFFDRLHKAGKIMVWLDEAPAFESVPPARVTVSWVCRRSFRGGQGAARKHVKIYTVARKVGWLIYKTIQLLASLILIPLVCVVSYKSSIDLLCRVCSATGYLSIIIFGDACLYKEYDVRHYRQDSNEKIK